MSSCEQDERLPSSAKIGAMRPQQPGATPAHRAVVLAEDDARDMRAVDRRRPLTAGAFGGRRQMLEAGPGEAPDALPKTDRPVEHGDADSRIAQGLRPEEVEPECRIAHGVCS